MADRDLPAEAVDEAERLTRRARQAVDDAEAAAYREDRDALLADHGYEARVREDEDGAVLALYPSDWVEDGTVRPDRIDDLDRGVERPLEGTGDPDDWEDIEAHNAELADRVGREHGGIHGANARALADFMSNHYARRIETASAAELAEFLSEYYPRNAWPSEEQRAVVERSIRLAFEAAGKRPPTGWRRPDP
ncbi:rnhA operon protein [Halobacteriales archaeon QS_1_68_17]|nr:MAG: rnhA operon protein [Halobacteriales archaeon QS_1_68_17]